MNVGILIASDSTVAGTREDKSGPCIQERCESFGFHVYETQVVCDDTDEIEQVLRQFIRKKYDLILTSGGTGFSPRDNTPEATKRVIEKEALGLVIAMIQHSLSYTPKAMLSRATAGIAEESLIINLPGSPKAVKENLDFLLPVLQHGLDVLKGDSQNCART